MTDKNIAILVRNLGKKYQIGGPQEKYLTLRDAIVNSVKAPFARFNRAPPNEEFWALKNVSFDVEQGEVVGIIGRNGAGKSTLLKILSRVTTPTEGIVELHGRVGSLLEVGTGFHPEMTGQENIFLNGSILGMKKVEIEHKFDEIVRFAEIDKFIDTPVKRYSSGMYVRLAFAVAAHMDTEILVVDEVLAVGDADFQKKCMGKMGDVAAKEGKTVLFVSHNMPAIARLCERTLLVDNGHIGLDGPSNKIISEYLQGGYGTKAKREWSDTQIAPGNDEIRLMSISLMSSEGKEQSEFSIDEDIIIKISYLNLKAGNRYLFNINFKDENGDWIFSVINTPSSTLEEDPWYNKPLPIGKFSTTVVIKKFLLNDKTFYIYLAIAKNDLSSGDPIIRLEDCLSLKIYDNGCMNKEYRGPFIGLVRPKLSWNTTIQNGEIR